MDRTQVLGFVLIFILLAIWMWMTTPRGSQTQKKVTQELLKDTLKVPPPQFTTEEKREPTAESYGVFFSTRTVGQEKILIIETDLYFAEVSTKGGLIRKWELKKFKTWDRHPVQLVDYEKSGDLSLLFASSDGHLVNTRNLYFDALYPAWQKIKLEQNQEYSVELTLASANGGRIVKIFNFKNGEYGFRVDLRLIQLGKVISNFEYQLVWESGLRYAEHNSIDESSFAAAYAYAGKELTEIDAARFEERVQKDLTGEIDWVATRNKYFAVALIPQLGASVGAYLEGMRKHAPDNGAQEIYSIAIKVPYKGEKEEKSSFRVFFGPVDIGILKSYGNGLEQIMSLGWVWVVRPISEYVMLPLMTILYAVIPNWGIVIIFFSFIIKIVLHPLTKSSMKSMKKMQALQPMMDEIREKYKDDPQKINQQIMNLYREYGVNPAGGCLPVLLQFPILVALYNVFRAAIELRQASFFWWITDLSIPDKIVTLPFTIPIFTIREVSGLALLMGITMFIQQKMSVKDPRQKAMVWLMPIMFTLLFNSFPSGLNLYYLVFNVLSIGQQILINRQQDNEPLRKVEPKKRRKGILNQLSKDFPKFGK